MPFQGKKGKNKDNNNLCEKNQNSEMFINNQVKIENVLETYIFVFYFYCIFTSMPLLELSSDQKEIIKNEVSPSIVK